MNSDIRYHIASLSAVFLALGIGILVGTAFVGTPVVQRQTTLIRRLEANVSDLRRETATRDNTEKALSALVPGIISGKLSGQQVLVVQSGSYRDAADAAAETLEEAGAVVFRIALPIDAWRREMSRATAAIADPDTIAGAVGQESARMAPLLLRRDPTDVPSPLQSYRDRGLLVGNVSPEKGPIRLVVLVGGASFAVASGGSSNESALQAFLQQRDIPMIQTWTARGVNVVAVEPLEAEVSFLSLYQGSDIATIDSIDRAAGQITLPFVLLGEKGDYGLRPGVDRVVPESLEGLRLAPPTPAPVPVSPAPVSSPAPKPEPESVPSAAAAMTRDAPSSPRASASPVVP